MIRTIILDFSGVLTTTDGWPSIAKTLSGVSGINEDEMRLRLYREEGDYILGKETTEKFWSRICSDCHISLEEFTVIIGAWYCLDEEMLKLVDGLNRKYEIVMLSDNYVATTSRIRNDERLKGLFHKLYFSNEIGLTKRNKGSAVFEFVLKNLNRKPKECVFIDDNAENLSAPRELGIHSTHFQGREKLQNTLAALDIRTE